MARYDRRILVPYLEDVCCAELAYKELDKAVQTLTQNLNAYQERKKEIEETVVYEKPVEGDYVNKTRLIVSVVAMLVLGMVGLVARVGLLVIVAIGGLLWQLSKNAEEQTQFAKALKEYERYKKGVEQEKASIAPLQAEIENLKKVIPVLVQRREEAKNLLHELYGINVIPTRYRNVRAAYFLYDFFRSGQSDDLDSVIQTMLLDEILQKLDVIIAQQSEIILQQRHQTALLRKTNEDMNRNHAAQMRSIAQLKENQYQQTEYLAMIEGNTRANAYFAAATWLQGLDR